MVVQTTYSINHGQAYAGMVADDQLLNTVTGLNPSGSGVTIPYGKGVVTEGVADDGVELPGGSSTAAEFVGVAMRELNRAYAESDTFGIPEGRDGSIVTQGVVWVLAAEDGIAKDDPVFLRVGATNLGDFANDAGTGVTASVAIAGAKFLTSGDEGDLVKISLGLGG